MSHFGSSRIMKFMSYHCGSGIAPHSVATAALGVILWCQSSKLCSYNFSSYSTVVIAPTYYKSVVMACIILHCQLCGALTYSTSTKAFKDKMIVISYKNEMCFCFISSSCFSYEMYRMICS